MPFLILFYKQIQLIILFIIYLLFSFSSNQFSFALEQSSSSLDAENPKETGIKTQIYKSDNNSFESTDKGFLDESIEADILSKEDLLSKKKLDVKGKKRKSKIINRKCKNGGR